MSGGTVSNGAVQTGLHNEYNPLFHTRNIGLALAISAATLVAPNPAQANPAPAFALQWRAVVTTSTDPLHPVGQFGRGGGSGTRVSSGSGLVSIQLVGRDPVGGLSLTLEAIGGSTVWPQGLSVRTSQLNRAPSCDGESAWALWEQNITVTGAPGRRPNTVTLFIDRETLLADDPSRFCQTPAVGQFSHTVELELSPR